MLTNTHIAQELARARQLELRAAGHRRRPVRRSRARRIRPALPTATRPVCTGTCVPAAR